MSESNAEQGLKPLNEYQKVFEEFTSRFEELEVLAMMRKRPVQVLAMMRRRLVQVLATMSKRLVQVLAMMRKRSLLS